MDDEPSLLELAPLLFKDYEVQATDDANGILKIISMFKPDIIMVDVIMGMRDGVEVCREIKSQSTFSNIPVILMTAGIVRDKDQLSGADAYIEKPFDFDETIALIESLTSK